MIVTGRAAAMARLKDSSTLPTTITPATVTEKLMIRTAVSFATGISRQEGWSGARMASTSARAKATKARPRRRAATTSSRRGGTTSVAWIATQTIQLPAAAGAAPRRKTPSAARSRLRRDGSVTALSRRMSRGAMERRPT